MPDVFTKAKRSEVMSRVRGCGNKATEFAMVALFRRHHITGWRRHQAVFGKPELDSVNDYDGAIPRLKMADPTGEYQTFLAFLPASLLARIYGEHGQRLLKRNVRAFLQAKGKVNRGLQKTLQEEPHRFLAYNNGLCCTAAEVRISGGKLEWLKPTKAMGRAQSPRTS